MGEQGELIPQKKEMRPSDLHVPDGTPLDIAVSSLIKELRRGNEFEALYWARELSTTFWRYMWRRLLIFCAEDIGMANPNLISTIIALREAYVITGEESRRSHGDYNFVALAIMLMARSPKNKDIGFAHMIQHLMIENGWKAEVPDYALDRHTKEGRQRYRTDIAKGQHWFQSAQVVANREGEMDYELWWARFFVRDGMLTRKSVEAWAERLNGLGRLRHGLEGPPWLMNPYLDPITGELTTEDHPEAVDLAMEVDD